ncbi:hypothetical protein [Winogradskyella sp. A3E31]|uniref:hypothetical protein n=1 Tax=Winogradskyella sp. A3E31 TaxID=3349637 RepID=UPI00398B6118
MFLIHLIFGCSSNDKPNFPIEEFISEVPELKNNEDYFQYWNQLRSYDQNVVMNAKNEIEYDSLCFIGMLKSALYFEKYDTSIFKSNPSAPALNLTHNQIAQYNLDFWPLIIAQQKATGKMHNFPGYQLESIIGNFYNYSVFNQDSIYPELLEKLKSYEESNISQSLLKSYKKQQLLNTLDLKSVIGRWVTQHFKDVPNERVEYFQFSIMSDDNIYLQREHRLQQLKLVKENDNHKIFEILDSPLGWVYKLSTDGNLTLINEHNQTLIDYKKA